ncbi:hypothetical protein AAES_90996 [Amazona aestiva]|uniref:Uncharacterized protein n=1 Tax=Amazona aestiva TaxID=12930 RepID=A0A0Q3R5F9_AMAAE|nr:hypothetical protein AAES_90996 [Amazona aestiva]
MTGLQPGAPLIQTTDAMSVVRKATMLMIVTAIVAEGGAGPGRDRVHGPEDEGILAHAVGVVVGGLGPDHAQGPGLLYGLEAGLGPMVDLNLAYLLKVTHHQEALEGVEVMKEWI